jgi:hypothetical protein
MSGEAAQLMPPADRQFGPAMQEHHQGRVLRAAREVERGVVRSLGDVFGDGEDHPGLIAP